MQSNVSTSLLTINNIFFFQISLLPPWNFSHAIYKKILIQEVVLLHLKAKACPRICDHCVKESHVSIFSNFLQSLRKSLCLLLAERIKTLLLTVIENTRSNFLLETLHPFSNHFNKLAS